MPDEIALRCTVRGCGRALRFDQASAKCASGHHFDRSRRGVYNLLQPQDKASLEPGDSKEVVAARRRTVDLGWVDPLRDQLLSFVSGARVADVGCGEGFLLGSLVQAGNRGVGVDLSTPAVELACRRWPEVRWVVANADRGLPLMDGSVDVVLSVTARRNVKEFRRVLKPGGRVILVVAGADDLIELRAQVQGSAISKDRSDRVRFDFENDFQLRDRFRVRGTRELSPDAQRDLLGGTYRGARGTQEQALAGLQAQRVTYDWEGWIWT